MPDSDKKNSPKRTIALSKISLLVSVAAGAVLVALLAMLHMTENIEVLQSRNDSGFVTVKDYTCRELEDTLAPIGIKKEYVFTISEELDNDTCLAFYTVHQYSDVYLDGKKIYSLRPAEENRISNTVGSNWIMIPLYREDAGKEICVEITPVYESFRDREVTFLIGSQLAIYRDRLLRDLPQLILGIMAIFVGIVFVCVAGYNLLRKHRGESLAALGLFSVMLGFWRLTDTRFTPFMIADRPVFLFYVSVTMLMLGMIPLVKWTEEYFTKGSRRILDSYCIVAALICLVQLLLQIFGMIELRNTLFVTHIMIGVGAVIILGIVVYERVRYPQKSRRFIWNKLSFICVAGVIADVAAFYIKGNSSGLIFSLLAFVLYIVIMGIATLYNYSEQEVRLAEQDRKLAEQERQLAEKERKLTERRITAMMSQIRTHFIFNVLATISSYCKTDPQKADDALIHFARYLRKNIKIIEEEGLIDFSVELEQLEDYIALEQCRFEDMITFKKDIQVSDFQIPPLTIQPIVENAIKHGLVEHGRSGTISLQTTRKSENIIITVWDDGEGFVSEECEKEDSVGIKNVRFRLETMVGGSLDIESVPGEGTTVTIKIPVKEIGKEAATNEFKRVTCR
ncbi:MAG: sensor histidine kinase [Lachnospiraceae bacterium]